MTSRLESERAQSQHYDPAHEVEALRYANERLSKIWVDVAAERDRYRQALERIVETETVTGAGFYRPHARLTRWMKDTARAALASGTQEQAHQ